MAIWKTVFKWMVLRKLLGYYRLGKTNLFQLL